MKKYSHKFYSDRHKGTLNAAETILTIVQEVIPEVHSVIDLGCGVGSWLFVLKQRGVEKILGVDGPWLDRSKLMIDQTRFMVHDLNLRLDLSDKYDLAISLEVAEHLSLESAARFVRSLTNLSDFVLFSAAIPGQGGTGHINEQWQDFWVELFHQQGYLTLDIVRNRIWNTPEIYPWYKQNTFLFVKSERVRDTSHIDRDGGIPINLIHPDLYKIKVLYPTLVQVIKTLVRSIRTFIISSHTTR